jgi:hypothetical protein
MSDWNNWTALEQTIGKENCRDYMFMGKVRNNIYTYKHIHTRRYINIDAQGQCYAYVSNLKLHDSYKKGVYMRIASIDAIEQATRE